MGAGGERDKPFLMVVGKKNEIVERLRKMRKDGDARTKRATRGADVGGRQEPKLWWRPVPKNESGDAPAGCVARTSPGFERKRGPVSRRKGGRKGREEACLECPGRGGCCETVEKERKFQAIVDCTSLKKTQKGRVKERNGGGKKRRRLGKVRSPVEYIFLFDGTTKKRPA